MTEKQIETEVRRLRAQESVDNAYIIALQQAIEYHCEGNLVPVQIAQKCPHHAALLNEELRRSKRWLL